MVTEVGGGALGRCYHHGYRQSRRHYRDWRSDWSKSQVTQLGQNLDNPD
ncbi:MULTISPECIES: hypothetical protein [Cyanophyceae]|nr:MULTISPECIES: hypothetical protein [Cyanophyceae]MBD1915478.1 hypothetical protein [Phormidium sp. FACHB-77]MBD2031788.1 hypothetical protein [Phormidium sp. FACHB-322]MBD2050538.1 hypothetical protein [Leptolyngbya sp. FACHB-60]